QLKLDPTMYAELVGSPVPNGKVIAEAEAFNIRFERWVYPRDLSFSWFGNTRIALKGGNGSGKTSLLKALLGNKIETRGKLRLAALEILYVDQQNAQLSDTLSIYENIRESSSLSESDIRNGLAKFLFRRDRIHQKVGTLSGGERLRVALAKGFLSREKPE